MKKSRNTNLAVCILLAGLAASIAQAQHAPHMISYQGFITSSGEPFDGTGYFKFALVDGEGDIMWSNDGTTWLPEPASSVEVEVANGLFVVLLGDTEIEGMDVPIDTGVMELLPQGALRIWFSEDDVTFALLSPDQPLASAPYALMVADLPNNFIGGQHISSEAVRERHLLPGAVTAAKLAADSVTAAIIQDGAVTSDKLAAGSVTGDKIAHGEIVGDHVQAGSLPLSRLAQSGAVTGQVIRWSPAGWVASDEGGGGGGSGVTGLVSYAESGAFIATPVASGTDSIAQGAGARASGNWSVVGGGSGNEIYAPADAAVIAGGQDNRASNEFSTVSGGEYNRALGAGSTVGGGVNSLARGEYSIVSGGSDNVADAAFSTVGGGVGNYAEEHASTVGGGSGNVATGEYATVAGGTENTARGESAAIGGGGYNKALASHAFVGGGFGNTASGASSTAGGGEANIASNLYSTVAGGFNNTAGGSSTAIGGGYANQAHGHAATVGGGSDNAAQGRYASVPGGSGNAAHGDYSLAAGRRAKAVHDGAFVWADSQNADFTSPRADSFNIRAAGGFYVNERSLGPLAYQSGPSFVVVEVTDDPPENGLRLLEAYAQAAALTPHGEPPGPENRVAVLVPPGQYDIGDQELRMTAEYVDLIGLTTARDDQRIVGVSTGLYSGVIVQTADNVIIENLLVVINRSPGATHFGRPQDPAAYFPASGLSNTVIRNCHFDTPNLFDRGMRMGIEYAGTYERVVTGEGGFGGGANGHASGIFRQCVAGDWSFGEGTSLHTGATGYFEDCIGGSFSFGGHASGTFVRCRAGSSSFGSLTGIKQGATGYFLDCQAEHNSFGAFAGASGTFINCVGGDNSFGTRSSGASGYFRNCVGGQSSFGSHVATPASGVFIGCKGGWSSFGFDGQPTGTFIDCVGDVGSFGGNGATLSGTFIRCHLLDWDSWTRNRKVSGRIEGCTFRTEIEVLDGASIFNSTFWGVTGVGEGEARIAHIRCSSLDLGSIVNLIGTPYNVVDPDMEDEEEEPYIE